MAIVPCLIRRVLNALIEVVQSCCCYCFVYWGFWTSGVGPACRCVCSSTRHRQSLDNHNAGFSRSVMASSFLEVSSRFLLLYRGSSFTFVGFNWSVAPPADASIRRVNSHRLDRESAPWASDSNCDSDSVVCASVRCKCLYEREGRCQCLCYCQCRQREI